MEELLAGSSDVRRGTWSDRDNPERPGVRCEVIWSDARQARFMRFTDLPINDPTREQYQLWIVDERGLVDATGPSARINGGVFSAPSGSTGELVIPITLAIKVGKAQIIAITIEKPGGTWASDMKRRVVIAQIPG